MATRAESITVIGNTGDDSVIHGLHVSPDLDIVSYTLAGIVDGAGWGIADDTTHALDQLRSYGVDAWFTLRDRDLGTHLARTHWLAEGIPLSEITGRIRIALGVQSRIIPMSDDPVPTRIVTTSGVVREFQEYFVQHRHADEVAQVRYEGAGVSSPAPGVLEAIERADRIIVCPSNPVLSIGPILAVPGVRAALAQRRSDVLAVSPIVHGAALKGPAARLLPVVGAAPTAAGVAGLYRDFCGTMVVDRQDEDQVPAIHALGMKSLVAQTIMRSPVDAKLLALQVLEP